MRVKSGFPEFTLHRGSGRQNGNMALKSCRIQKSRAKNLGSRSTPTARLFCCKKVALCQWKIVSGLHYAYVFRTKFVTSFSEIMQKAHKKRWAAGRFLLPMINNI